MNNALSQTSGVTVASRLLNDTNNASGPDWKFENLLGRLVELSGAATTATLTTTASLILQAQFLEEPVAWIAVCDSTFYPPDFAASGVDLEALPVIRINDQRKAVRVADMLLRSGGFGLVVMDFGKQTVLHASAQTRLAGLAQKYNVALLCLTRKEADNPSLGSLVSLRASVCRARTDFNRFSCELRVEKDKRRGPGWRRKETCRGPAGLC
jgi:recombination protein RecA